MYGIEEIDPATLSQWREAGQPVRIIDVRSVNEHQQAAIPEGELIPLHTLPVRASELKTGQHVVLYCHSGARSAQACAYLKQQGVEKVYNLAGGIMRWAREGLPLATAAQQ